MLAMNYDTVRCLLRGVPDRSEGSIVIQRGLTMAVRGHLIDLDRDESAKVARVRVAVVEGYAPTGAEFDDVRKAAGVLAERARRFLGVGWTVVPWVPE